MPDPTFQVAPSIPATQNATQANVQYRPGPLFDFIRGDFQRDGNGHIINATGHVAWGQRGIKRVLTRRRSTPLYSPTYGTTLDLDIRQPTRKGRESAVVSDVRGQLRQDPATLDADQFTFNYRGRAVDVHVRVIPRVGSPIDVGFPDLFSQT